MNHIFTINRCKGYLDTLLKLIADRRDYLEYWNFQECDIIADTMLNELYIIADSVVGRINTLEQYPKMTLHYIEKFYSYRWALDIKHRKRFDSIFRGLNLSPDRKVMIYQGLYN